MPLPPARPVAAALLVALLVSPLTAADVPVPPPSAPLPKPEAVTSLAVHPAKVALRSGDDSAQLVVTGTLADGRTVDLTGDVLYSLNDAKVATVSSAGRVLPRANGATEVVVNYGAKAATVPVSAAHVGEDLPINFPNQVVPVFTKLGCNSGGCHGKQSGQNGFRLSLLGFEPELDFATLVKEARGRRLLPGNPEKSLFLMKATGATAHGGGRKMEPGSDEYKVVRRWIGAGMPWGADTDPVVTRVSVVPDHRVLTKNARQQFAAYAHYSDGSVEDVTRRAQYETNDPDVAAVSGEALVRTLNMSGEAAVMARYRGHVAVLRVTVPVGVKVPDWKWEPKTVVDTHTARKWRDLGLVPSDACTDGQFIRRASLDITGTLPTPAAVTAFAADPDPAKRDKLVDKLVDSPEYAELFANKWADVLRVKRRGETGRAPGTFAFREWIRQQVAADVPYSDFARGVLTASGNENTNPPTVWYKEMEKPENFVDDTAQVFLGQRLACAQCHHHPYEKWGQDDYWGLAAFFGRVGKKEIRPPLTDSNQNDRRFQVVFTKSAASGGVTNKRTNKPAVPTPLDGQPMTLAAEDDPRHKLVDWMVAPGNPFFAKAVANRYAAHFLGRGIVDPLDDMRVTNPPSNPELLDALAKDLVDNKYSLKSLVKTLCKSRTYQLSSVPNEWNRNDKQAYARYYPRRMQAEVLFDAVCQVTDSPSAFSGLPKDRNAPARAVQLPDESFTSYFLDVFGRPQRISACECERVSEANLAQALHLLNSEEVQQRITRAKGRADALAADPRPDAAKVEELFLWAFARKPTADDSAAALAHIEKVTAAKQGKKAAYENLVWALLNTKEFVFNQ